MNSDYGKGGYNRLLQESDGDISREKLLQEAHYHIVYYKWGNCMNDEIIRVSGNFAADYEHLFIKLEKNDSYDY